MQNEVKLPIVKAGVGVVVCRNHKVLIGKRLGGHGKGLWSFPGGHIEPTDRSLKACGEREVFEETGITCNVYSPDHYREDLFTTFDILSEDGSKVYVTCYLVAEYLIGGNVINGENGEYLEALEPHKCEGWYWKSLDELAQMISDDKERTWIPVNQVVHYLSKIWEEK